MIELLLTFSLMSHHFNDPHHWKEFNPGVGIEMRNEGYHVGIGAYRNSVGDISTYGVVGWERIKGWVGGGIEVGAATGYAWPLVPIVSPYVVVGKRLQVKVNVLPWERPIVGVMVRWRV